MKNVKKSPDAPAEAASLTFDAAIQRLEAVVAEMESAELPLEQLIEKYEEGVRLLRLCNEKLNEAQRKIEILRKKADGSLEAEPFEVPNNSRDAQGEKLF